MHSTTDISSCWQAMSFLWKEEDCFRCTYFKWGWGVWCNDPFLVLVTIFRERKWWTFVRSTLSVSDRQADAEPISLICVCGSSKAVLSPSLTPLQEKQAKILIMTAKAVTGHIFPQEQHRNKKNFKRKTCAIPLVSCCFLQTVIPCSHLQLSLDSQFCNIST